MAREVDLGDQKEIRFSSCRWTRTEIFTRFIRTAPLRRSLNLRAALAICTWLCLMSRKEIKKWQGF